MCLDPHMQEENLFILPEGSGTNRMSSSPVPWGLGIALTSDSTPPRTHFNFICIVDSQPSMYGRVKPLIFFFAYQLYNINYVINTILLFPNT
jgi:hypothetical protein